MYRRVSTDSNCRKGSHSALSTLAQSSNPDTPVLPLAPPCSPASSPMNRRASLLMGPNAFFREETPPNNTTSSSPDTWCLFEVEL